MAKTAIFSDIHGNIDALEAVIDDARAQGVNNFACLGDIVGYGPHPISCIAKIQEINCVCVKGNHDEDSSNDRDLSNLNQEAQKSLYWTRDLLSASQREWLANLPLQRRLGRNLLTHACVANPDEWDYVRNKFDASIQMMSQRTPITFIGHTHIPIVYTKVGNNVSAAPANNFAVNQDEQYLINVGSVGQPRDGIPKASYVIFDRTERIIAFRRINYDINKVINDIKQAGLPKSLGERLNEAA